MIVLVTAIAVASPPASPSASVAWTTVERAQLERGEVVYRHHGDAGGQHGRAAVLLHAPAQALWAELNDFAAWVDYLPYVTDSWTVPTRAGSQEARGGYALTTRGLTTRYAVEHHLDPAGARLDFTLTPLGPGPVGGGQGWWHVQPWDEGRLLVEYGVDLDLRWWVPEFVAAHAASAGLPRLVGLTVARAEAGQPAPLPR